MEETLKSKRTVVDLFSGGGGASLGFRMAGFEVVAAADNDPTACSTYAENLGLNPLRADLRALSGRQLLSEYGLHAGSVDVVVGCPPCQGFSTLTRTRHSYGDDEKNGLIAVFVRRVREIRPKAVLFENVAGIALAGWQYLQLYLREMEKSGYKTAWNLLDAADYGVPQHRKRLIAVSVEAKTPPSLPRPTHTNPAEAGNGMPGWRTVREAIGDLPALEPGETDPKVSNHVARTHTAKVLRIITAIPKNGGCRHALPPHLWLDCHRRLASRGGGATTVYGRLAWDEPAPTITCRCTTPSSGRFIHPDQDRAITPREAARLQTFPDTFVFPSQFKSTERLIGNAVPVLLAATLAQHLKAIL